MTPGVFRCKRKTAAVKKITKIKYPQKVYHKQVKTFLKQTIKTEYS
jgi:hypothetical protein